MNLLSDTIDSITEPFNFALKPLVDSPTLFTFISLFMILYVSSAKPKLPVIIRQMFDNGVFRFVVLSLILWRSNKDIKSSIMLAMGFILTLQIANKQKTEDMINNIIYKQYKNMENFTDEKEDYDEFTNTQNDTKIIPDFNYNCDQFGQLISELSLKKTEAEVKCLSAEERINKIDIELNKTEDQLKGNLRCQKNLIECGKNQGKECGIEYIACLNSIK
jgi:hypothetical protein